MIGCGLRCNHNVLVRPEGWVRDGKEKWFCPTCAPFEAEEPPGVMNLPTKKEWLEKYFGFTM